MDEKKRKKLEEYGAILEELENQKIERENKLENLSQQEQEVEYLKIVNNASKIAKNLNNKGNNNG